MSAQPADAETTASDDSNTSTVQTDHVANDVQGEKSPQKRLRSASMTGALARIKTDKKTPSMLEKAKSTDSSRRRADGKVVADESDPNVVSWDGPDDQRNPLNWSNGHRWHIAVNVALLGMISPLASSIIISGIPQIDDEFGVSNRVVGELTTALFVLGLGFGPLFFAPLSELIGRKIVYLISFGFFIIFNILCAVVQNMPGLVILRFLAGCFGSAGPSLGASTIGDMFDPKDRGSVMSIYFLGPLIGPTLGPLISSFIVENTTWRWIFWLTTIASSVIWISSIISMQETYAPVLLKWKTQKLRRESGNMDLHPAIQVDGKNLLVHSLLRPLRLLLKSPICLIMSLYTAFVYGVLYMVFVTIPLLFSPNATTPSLFSYEWGIGTSGLAYLGPGIGLMTAAVVSSQVQDRVYRRLCKTYGRASPELRLPLVFIALWLTPTGLLLFGWTATAQVWPGVPLIGLGIFAAGMMMAFMGIQIYLVDVFAPKLIAASALAAVVLLRSILGCVLPLVSGYMYENLGYGWGCTILAGAAALMIPIPILLWYKGEEIRARDSARSF